MSFCISPVVAGGRERRQQIVVEVREHDLLHADDVGRGGDELREQRSAPGRPGPRGRIDVRVLGVLAGAPQVAVGQNVPLPPPTAPPPQPRADNCAP